MLVDPRRSRLVFINPARVWNVSKSEQAENGRHHGLSLLPAVRELFGIAAHIVGECDPKWRAGEMAEAWTCLDVDPLMLWRHECWRKSKGASDIQAVFLGGAWLEEEVLVVVLMGAGEGYDVRLLTDCSVARDEQERQLVVDRLAIHGVLATTLRQAMLEWAAFLNDPVMIDKVRGLLSQSGAQDGLS